MSKRIRVVVTQADIDTARAEERAHKARKELWMASLQCPVARSLYRRFQYASVGAATATAGPYNDLGHFTLPPRAVEFIRKFDKRLAVEPITFTMRAG